MCPAGGLTAALMMKMMKMMKVHVRMQTSAEEAAPNQHPASAVWGRSLLSAQSFKLKKIYAVINGSWPETRPRAGGGTTESSGIYKDFQLRRVIKAAECVTPSPALIEICQIGANRSLVNSAVGWETTETLMDFNHRQAAAGSVKTRRKRQEVQPSSTAPRRQG